MNIIDTFSIGTPDCLVFNKVLKKSSLNLPRELLIVCIVCARTVLRESVSVSPVELDLSHLNTTHKQFKLGIAFEVSKFIFKLLLSKLGTK